MYKGQIICIIIIMFIGVYHYQAVQKGTKQSKPSKWFTRLLYMSFFQLIFDIWSVYTVNHLYTVSPILNRVVHMFYMGLMQMLFYLAYKYLEAVIEEETKEKIIKHRWYADLPITLGNLGIVFLPLEYIETPQGNYSYGPAAFTLYIGVFVYIILILRNLVKYWKIIPIKKRTAIIIAILSQVVVAVYQIMIPTSLISCLGIALLNLGIYLTTENPDAVLVELLEKETKRADVANQAKTDFLAKMSHEIRTPINAVLGMNEVILRETKESHIREYAKDVEGAANSLLSIINDILDITKIEAGKITVIPVEYDFSSIIHDVTNMISFKAHAKSLDFHVCIDEKIPNRLLGDDIRIRQILVNILNNAVKYTHEGSVTLEIGLLPYDEEETALISFAVKDTGIGIKEEDIPKLSVAFERIEEKRNRSIEGTGLGMNITMQLLSLMDSSLKVESVYGEGSVFSFVLKQKILNPEPIGNLEKRIEERAKDSAYKKAFIAPKASILVVDDNATNLKVMANLLKVTEMKVDTADGGYTCLEMVRRQHYDLIFLDHMMPDLDGIETLHQMQQLTDSMCKETPVIALTANAVTGAKEMYLEHGFQAFLAKPIVPDKLEQLIMEMLPEEVLVFDFDDGETGTANVENTGLSEICRPVSEKNCANTVKTDAQKRETKKSIKNQNQGDLEEMLPEVEGIRWEYGMVHLRDAELLRSTAIDFYRTIDSEADCLEIYFKALPDSADALKQYRIKVHAMKSTAALIGAVQLSGVAKLLEFAARDAIALNEIACEDTCENTPENASKVQNKMDIIQSVTPVFLADWRSYKEKLKCCMPEEEKREIDDISIVYNLLEQLRAAMEDMDIDASDETIEKIRGYAFAEAVQKLVDELSTAVVNLDSDGAGELIDEILMGIK